MYFGADDVANVAKASVYGYSLDMLPVTGISSPVQTVAEVQGRLNTTQLIVNELLAAPFSMTTDLKQAIANIKFHVVNGLSLIDAALQQGVNSLQPYTDITGLKEAIENHVIEVSKAMLLWDPWLKDQWAHHTANDPPLPRLIDKTVTGGQTPATSSLLAAAQPLTVKDYVTLGVVAGGIVLLWRLFTK